MLECTSEKKDHLLVGGDGETDGFWCAWRGTLCSSACFALRMEVTTRQKRRVNITGDKVVINILY